MRVREEFERLGAELALAGHVELTPTALDLSTELNAEERARLGRIHLQKIAMSDEASSSTWATTSGKAPAVRSNMRDRAGVAVSYLEPHAPDYYADN